MSESALKVLKNKKTQIKKSLTRFNTYSSTISESTNIFELKKRYSVAEQCLAQFGDIQEQIEALEESDTHDAEREEFENNYFEIIARVEKFLLDNQSIPQNKIHDHGQISHQAANNTVNNLRLPTIQLPSFSGAYDEWFPYHDTFYSLIHTNCNLNEIQKFHYLKSSIQGEASNVISSLEITAANYNEAWEMLKERYNNKRLIVQRHVRAIFELPTTHKENCSILRQILDGASKHLRALKALQRSTESWDDLLIHLISSKIDHITNKEWENSILKNEIPSFKQMKDFLLHKCETLEMMSNSSLQSSQRKPPSKPTFSHVATQKQTCASCKGSHLIYHCSDFLKMSIEKRLQRSKDKGLCINCLKHGHQLNKCTSGPCKECGKRHNTLLHFPTQRESDSKNVSPNVSEALTTISTHAFENVPHILLSTAIIKINDNRNKGHHCRILLDSGSQSNFITKELANKLKLHYHPANIPVIGINRVKSQVAHYVNANISSTYNGFRTHIKCLVLENIAENIPQVSVERSKITIPKNITLADPNFNVSNKIDMLIGAEIFWSLLCVGQIKTAINQPYLQKTQLGWIVSGKMTENQGYPNTFCNLSLKTNLESSLTKFWEIEEIKQKKPLTVEERACEDHFSSTFRRHENGRFIVQLPLKADTTALGDSKQGAIKRLYSLERKLAKQPQLKVDYDNFMREYLELNHMVKVTNEGSSASKDINYYLPHHAVVKEDSLTTRLRVVFDGSAKTSKGTSLNDILMVGPNLQEDLLSIILRFRTYQYVITADIAKMYRQILLDKSQTSLQRILWRFDPSKDIDEYELLTVTYGTASASYLAIKAMQQLAVEETESYPTGSSIVLRDFYVDDLLTGANTISEAKTIISELTKLLPKGGFNLRKWSSNCKSLLDIIPNSSAESVCLNLSKDSVKTLGLQWNADSDILRFQLKSLNSSSKVTKRSILSKTSQLFDPLGLLSPVIIKAKMMMQRLWLLNITWDESVPSEIHSDWIQFERQLEYLHNITIPRQVTAAISAINVEICGFCDASERAYGACVYIRSTGADGTINSKLLCSKSRVAPTKCLSLPRLELCGALVLSQLVEKVLSSLTIPIKHVRLWTDSTIVLFWLKSPSRTWKTFISNRVSEIQTLTKVENWNHVRTNENPADLISRGTALEQLSKSKLWWHGPDWLSMPEEHFPTSNVIDLRQIDQNQLEKRSDPDTFVFLIHDDFNIFNRYSDLNKLTRIVAYCMRFRRNLSAKINKFQDRILTGTLTSQELDCANKNLIRLVQQEAFAKELHCLRKKQPVPHGSKLLCLNPFIDDEELIRVGGRIQNSKLSYDKRHQIVLPSNHIFTRLLIEREHQRLLHAGVQQTTASLRSKYWPLSARGTVRNVIRKCIPCFKAKPQSEDYIMGNLPRARIEPARPFLNTGVDYCGPFHIREGTRRNSRITKVYAALFICFATKATHIEIVSSLSSEAFISTLKRFIARRGHPAHMYSDNGSNFMGANRELQRLRTLLEDSEQERILESLSQRSITWHFIPARSPHFGGLWEAAIKSAKNHLHRITGNAHLSFEELHTLFTQIEAVLNSRPLIPMSEDPNDLTFLTPGHFLIGESLTDIMEPNLTTLKLNRLSRWQHVEQLKQHFWTRWSKEYLSQLQVRTKWKRQVESSLLPGKLVLVKEDGIPPHRWISGRVLSIHPGADGITRAATIRTATGTTKRASNRLCILPIDD